MLDWRSQVRLTYQLLAGERLSAGGQLHWRNDEGQLMNVNADQAATALAATWARI